MVDFKTVEKQLKAIGCNFRYFGRPEIKELGHILMPNETIAQCVNGQYEGGMALLCATDQRLLLIDKKPMYLTIEDIRYDMITEVGYSHKMMDASIRVFTANKNLIFTSVGVKRMRIILNHVQQRVTEVRQRQTEAQAAEIKLANHPEEVLSEAIHQPALAQAAEPAHNFRQSALEHIIEPAKIAQDNFNGFRKQVAWQIAEHLGPRAVAFSQLPPVLSAYKLPFSSRRPTPST